jgi:hypothetical protein
MNWELIVDIRYVDEDRVLKQASDDEMNYIQGLIKADQQKGVQQNKVCNKTCVQSVTKY